MFAVMAIVALPFALRGPRIALGPHDDRACSLGNTAFDALNVLTFFAALSHTTVAIAVLTHYLAPILIALAAPRIDGTCVARRACPRPRSRSSGS